MGSEFSGTEWRQRGGAGSKGNVREQNACAGTWDARMVLGEDARMHGLHDVDRRRIGDLRGFERRRGYEGWEGKWVGRVGRVHGTEVAVYWMYWL